MLTFSDLDLIEPLERAVAAQNYTQPTAIQIKAIPLLLEGRDLLGCAQTGTGKTAAFALPILQHLHSTTQRGKRQIRALVLSPTRELAAQIDERFRAYGEFLTLRSMVMFGGVSEHPQIQSLRRGVDILVATPGRLLDLLGRGFVDLSDIEFFVLDEADRMLDMGFIHDIRRVVTHLPDERQTLLFSATMPKTIERLAQNLLYQPTRVDATPPSSTVERIEQRVYFVDKRDKKRLLGSLLNTLDWHRALVFTRTKHGANRLVKQLDRYGVSASAIHGNKSQNARNRAMDGFKNGQIPVLIATDIASRGIDVEGISHVFNYDLTNEAEVYVHRIGRTARAGSSGTAISFCDSTERAYLRDIERLIGFKIDVVTDHAFVDSGRPRSEADDDDDSRRRDGGRGRFGGGNRGREGDRRGQSRGRSSPRTEAAPRDSSSAPAEGGENRTRRRRRRPPRSPAPGQDASPERSQEPRGQEASSNRNRSRRPSSSSDNDGRVASGNRQAPATRSATGRDDGQPPRRRRRRRGPRTPNEPDRR